MLKTLIKSKSEDVLWQAAGMIHNLMGYDVCKKVMVSGAESSLRFSVVTIYIQISRGVTAFIFELASSGFKSVRHLCSASLHMMQDNLPDMEDPAVLQLLWCLLEADGTLHSRTMAVCLTVELL